MCCVLLGMSPVGAAGLALAGPQASNGAQPKPKAGARSVVAVARLAGVLSESMEVDKAVARQILDQAVAAAEGVGLRIIQAKRDEIKGEPWPLSPPPLCVEAADKHYALEKSDMARIQIEKLGWTEGALV